MKSLSIDEFTDVKIGHHHDPVGITGCTAILFEKGATAGIDVRGSASGSRETDPLQVMHVVDRIHGILLAGGSAFGLAAASGVMTYLEEKKIGFPVGVTKVPIVPSAIIFDLKIGDHTARPSPEMAYQACCKAGMEKLASGNVGVGIGATAGKYFGPEYAMKSGFGSYAVQHESGIFIGAVVVANPYGDIMDPALGKIICGCRYPHGETTGLAGYLKTYPGHKPLRRSDFSNTTLGVIITNVKLDKREVTKVAQLAQNGIPHIISPAHTVFDGDIVFAASCGPIEADLNWVGTVAAHVLSKAILDAAYNAADIGPFPACTTGRPNQIAER